MKLFKRRRPRIYKVALGDILYLKSRVGDHYVHAYLREIHSEFTGPTTIVFQTQEDRILK